MIADSEFSKSSVVGIYSQGKGARQTYLRLKFENIDGPGIRVHKGNECKIKGCEFSKCQIGIEVISANPFIFMNEIR